MWALEGHFVPRVVHSIDASCRTDIAQGACARARQLSCWPKRAKRHSGKISCGLALGLVAATAVSTLSSVKHRVRRLSSRPRLAAKNVVSLVDLGGLSWLGNEPPQHIVAEVRRACMSTGFFLVVGHGVPKGAIDAVLAAASHFFTQTLEEKQSLVVHDMERSRGWEMSPQHRDWQEHVLASTCNGIGSSPSATQGIITERFCCGPARCDPLAVGLDAQDRTHYGRVFCAENVWPSSCPEWQVAMQAYYSEMERLSRGLSAVLAAAAGAPWSYFDGPLLERHSSNLQVAHYPAQPSDWAALRGPAMPLRVKAHADSGTFTILHRTFGEEHADGGLEIYHDGEWHKVPALEGALCVNLGNLFQYYTAGLFASTKHRVTNPGVVDGEGDDQGNVTRHSIAFFHKPKYDAVCQPIGDGLQRLAEGNYPPVKIGNLCRAGFIWRQRAKGLRRAAAARSYHRRMYPSAYSLPAALLLDCDGVIADTEPAHRIAFNAAFAELGLDIVWSQEEYGHWLMVSGAKERCMAYFDSTAWPLSVPNDASGRCAFLEEIQRRQNAAFRLALQAGRVPVRPGIARVVAEACAAGVPVAVVSSSSRAAVEAVVATLGVELPVFAGDCVQRKKPSPDIYLLAAESLDALPSRCIAIEDSPGGLAAAVAAGIACAITEAMYTRGKDFSQAGLVAPSLADVSLEDLAALVPSETEAIQ